MNGFSEHIGDNPPSQGGTLDLNTPPWVEVQGIDNFRDIGGYAIAGAGKDQQQRRSVRRNFCYRCADPARITPAGKAKVEALGITTFYDLRSASEREKNTAALQGTSTPQNDAVPSTSETPASTDGPTPTSQPFLGMKGVLHAFTPVFEHRDFSPEAVAHYTKGGTDGFTNAYRDILQHGERPLRAMLEHVRDHPEEPFALHCSAGKDRTGVLTAVMLKLVGVSDEDVAKEYELTEIGLEPMREIILAYLRKQPVIDTDEEGLRRMVSARGENMLAVLKMLQKEYGGAEAYVKKCGFSDADIAVIKKHLTSDEPPLFS